MTHRTYKQNRSLHLYCRQLANALNHSGQYMGILTTDLNALDIEWTSSSIRKFMFNRIALAMYQKTSSQLDTKEIQKVYDVLNMNTGEKLGVSLDWPHEEDQ